MKIVVKKRTGKLQPFTLAKIMRSVQAAGAGAKLVQEVTSDVAGEILGDIRRGAETLVVPSQRIRKLVVRSLSRKNRRLATKYETFKKRR